MSAAACSFDERLVTSVQEHMLEALCPLSRPAVEHEVELLDVVQDLRLQLLEHKVRVSCWLQTLCSGSEAPLFVCYLA